MSYYYPKDKYGNRIAFRIPEPFVVDNQGVNLTRKLELLREAFDNADLPENIPTRIYYDHTEGKVFLYSGDKIVSQTELQGIGGGVTYAPSDVYNVNISKRDSELTIRWNDPSDSTYNGVTIAAWGGTKVLYKTGDFPEDENDGTLIVDNKERNKYSTDGIRLTGLTNNTTYYIRFFPYSLSGDVNTNIGNKYTGTPDDTVIYGFKINTNDSNPESSVTYIGDAVGKRPVKMNFINNTFSWGDWDKDEFFMPKPCMLRYDGTVDYYLDPDDYTKKADGTPSNISDSTYFGNAMMEWGRDGNKIWYKVVPENNSNSCTVYISNKKNDNEYVAWSFYDCNNEPKDHFYTPIYNGYLIDGRLRSISGRVPVTYKDADDEITYAVANNNVGTNIGIHWFTEVFADRLLINYLLVLIGKSLDTQAVFGHGYTRDKSVLQTGTMNTKGMFYGEATGESGVKVFGMEHYWGNMRRRTAGILMSSGTFKYKLTYGRVDGSSEDGYNIAGSGYISGKSITSTGYISKMSFLANGTCFPQIANGSSSSYYSDYIKYNTGSNYVAFGGPCDDDQLYDYDYQSGAFTISANLLPSKVDYLTGASVSFR